MFLSAHVVCSIRGEGSNSRMSITCIVRVTFTSMLLLGSSRDFVSVVQEAGAYLPAGHQKN